MAAEIARAYALYGLAWAKLDQGDNAGAEAAVDTLTKKHAEHPLLARGGYVRGMARQQLASTPRRLKISRRFWRPIPRRPRKPTPGTSWGCARRP